MKSIFVENSKKKHKKYVSKIISSADELYILVAFLKNSGLDLICSDLEECIRKSSRVTIVVGLDLYITDPDALVRLHRLCKESSSRLFIYKSKAGVFHPKIYASRGKKYKVMVGSSNLTSGGLVDNTEASLYLSSKSKAAFTDVKKMFRRLLNEGEFRRSTLLNLQQYKSDYEIYSSKIEDATEEASDELENSFTLDLENLQEYIEEYLGVKAESDSWLKRRNDYVTAEETLNTMLDGNIESSDAFLYYYGPLVGQKGGEKLWHSGSIYRSKNSVALEYELFIEMLSTLKESIGGSPVDMYELAKPYVDAIHGLGYNVVTEILQTYAPDKYPILNNNPLESIKHLGFSGFKKAEAFNGEEYQQYSEFMIELNAEIGFDNLMQVDQFLNYIFWEYAKPSN